MHNHTVELTQSEVSTLLSYLDAGKKYISKVYGTKTSIIPSPNSEEVKTIVSKLEGAVDSYYYSEYGEKIATNFAHFNWEQARAEAVVDTVGAERILQQIQDMVADSYYITAEDYTE